MKRKIVLVLLMALALVSVATAEVTVSGEFEYGMMTNADEFAGEVDKIEVNINADIDEYNSFSMEIEDKDGGNATAGTIVGISWATVTTDWGALFSLPVGVTTTVGYDGFGFGDNLYATGWGLENFGGVGLNTEGSMALDIVPAEMVTLGAAMNFDPDQATTEKVEMAVGAAVNVAPVSLEVYYVSANDDFAEGAFGTEALFSMAVADGMNLDVAGSFVYDLDTEAYYYGAGVGFSAFGALLGVSFNGNDVDALNNLGVDVNYGITEALSADVAALFDLTDAAADTFLGLDVSATYKAGAVSYTLGYLYSDGYGADANYNAETACADGGVYMGVALDF